ncbi:accessory factor UbiK family protein [Candidatus Foliamicus sp.]
MNEEFISDLAKRLRKLVPDTLQGAAGDLETNFRAMLQAALGKGDYVTFEEFEAQKRVLERTREKAEALERTLAELEEKRD